MNRAQLLVVLSIFVVGCKKAEYQIDASAIVWDGSGDGIHWSDAANWTTDAVPAMGDHIVVRGHDVIVDMPVTIDVDTELYLIDARLTVAPNMVLANMGRIVLDNGKIFTDSQASFVNEGDVDGLGDVVFACGSDGGGGGTVTGTVGVDELSCSTCTNAGFDFIPAGTQVMSQYSGVTITALNAASGPDKAIIFDSANPSVEDEDLRTPGPGTGNDTPLGGVLIIAENDTDADGDGLIDVPDDNAAGGTLVFDFTCAHRVTEVAMVDIEEQHADIELVNFVDHDADVTTPPILSIVHTAKVPPSSNNSVQIVDFSGAPPAIQMRVNLPSSGAVANVNYCLPY